MAEPTTPEEVKEAVEACDYELTRMVSAVSMESHNQVRSHRETLARRVRELESTSSGVQAGEAGTPDTSNPNAWVAMCRERCANSIMNTGTGAWLGTALAIIESQARRVQELEEENKSLRREIQSAGNEDFDWSVLRRLDDLELMQDQLASAEAVIDQVRGMEGCLYALAKKSEYRKKYPKADTGAEQ